MNAPERKVIMKLAFDIWVSELSYYKLREENDYSYDIDECADTDLHKEFYKSA